MPNDFSKQGNVELLEFGDLDHVVQVQLGANIVKKAYDEHCLLREQPSTSRTSAHPGSLLFMQALCLDTKIKRRNHGFSQQGHLTTKAKTVRQTVCRIEILWRCRPLACR